MKPQWIKASGEVETVMPKNGTDFQLDELQDMVRGTGEKGESDTITIVYLTGNRVMVANDDGLIIGLQKNERATAEYMLSGGMSIIVGNVLIAPKEMVK